MYIHIHIHTHGCFLKMGDHQVSMGFNTKPRSNGLDDVGVPGLGQRLHCRLHLVASGASAAPLDPTRVSSERSWG